MFLNGKCPLKSSFVIHCKAAELAEYDNDLLEDAHTNIDYIRALLFTFSEWVHDKRKTQRKIAKNTDRFVLVAHNGRFSRDLWSDPQVLVRAVALSVLQAFLSFCSKARLIKEEDEDGFLNAAWAAILPESSPTPPAEAAAAIPPDWANADTFWSFMTEYLGDEADISINEKGKPATKALISALQGDMILILPREKTCTAYRSFLERSGSCAPSKGFELDLVHTAIDQWGIHLLTEGDDITWRYRFYQTNQAPVNGKEKLPCLGLPIAQLPENVRRILPPDARSGNGKAVAFSGQNSDQKEGSENA